MKWWRGFVLAWSSFGGLGYMPVAPGTFGTIGGIAVWALFAQLPLRHYVLATAAAVLFAIFISSAAETFYGRHDMSQIVIDEVVGLLCTGIGVPFAWPQVLAGFVLFRLFDITKPPPIRWLDKNMQGGAGVVMDDVAAGLVACAVMHGAKWALGGWW